MEARSPLYHHEGRMTRKACLGLVLVASLVLPLAGLDARSGGSHRPSLSTTHVKSVHGQPSACVRPNLNSSRGKHMGEDLKAQLEKLYPEHVALVKPAAAKHPPYCVATIEECYARFCQEIAGKDYADQRGKAVSILEENFPKLLNLKVISSGQKAKASKVLNSLRNGTFDSSIYGYERDRLATLFWVPEVICDSDAIHPNGHSAIQGEEVYVKFYDKDGAPVKLVFVAETYAGRRVVTTSFLTTPDRLCKFLKLPPLWEKTKGSLQNDPSAPVALGPG